MLNKSKLMWAEAYRENGYLFPLDIFSQPEVAAMMTALDAGKSVAAERLSAEQIEHCLRVNAHIVLPFIFAAAQSPKLLEAVSCIMGPNLLLWGAEIFVKPAKSRKMVSWHQDLTYWGLGETENELTAWIALSDVTVESGCMRFLPGSHKRRIQPHRDTFDENNLLSRGQEVAVEVNEEQAVNVILKPGQVSLHHGKMFHASGPNTANNDRIGLVLRYITPEVKQQVAKRDYAMLVKGVDEGNNWVHVAPPVENFSSHDLDLHKRIRADQIAALGQGAERKMNMYSGY